MNVTELFRFFGLLMFVTLCGAAIGWLASERW